MSIRPATSLERMQRAHQESRAAWHGLRTAIAYVIAPWLKPGELK